MSNPLSELDRDLLGEVPHDNEAEPTMAKANGGPGHGDTEDFPGAEFNPLNGPAGALVKVSSSGDEIEPGKGNKDSDMEDAGPSPKTPKKRGAAAAANDGSAQPSKKRSPTKKASAATNGDASETVSPSKKRASPKKKNATSVNVKKENGKTDEETEGLEPVTPKTGKRTTGKGKATKADNDSADTTDKSVSPTKGNGVVESTTVHNTPRKRQAPKKELAAPRGIPGSWDDADNADRMLVTMKENGEGWAEIRAAWKVATGQDTASSTLPNRYNRIKVNMMHLKEGDETHLLLAKKDIEDHYNVNFWSNVAANMERRGAEKYPIAFLSKTFKELEAAGKTDLNAANGNTDTGTASNGSASASNASTSNGTASTTATTDGDDKDVIMKEEDTGDGDDA